MITALVCVGIFPSMPRMCVVFYAGRELSMIDSSCDVVLTDA